ncbi:phage late control D family protein [Herbaspirillum sp. YR522]|uniref:phage late control D family protein n=1 Tax=Herbaspirillum sp. YR522 TaxID=1144342 RepID=UPI00026FAAE9|nr:hypothetical protein [Herbaspirillum sp. YR522]EJN07782.1 phage protein D [Herbaspirillum sp. YR522]
MINEAVVVSDAKAPRGMVFANGERIEAVLSFTVDNNSFFQADTFRLEVAMSQQPAGRRWDWWAVQENLQLEFYLGFPADPDYFTAAELTRFLVGNVDDLEFDPVRDIMLFTGRDLTSKLIDYKRTISFSSGSLVASDIVTKIAIERGLKPVVTKTQAAAGSYYQIVKALVETNCTYWDIVTRLAQIEHFQAYVKGNELHFEPRTSPGADPYVLQWQEPTDPNGFPIANAPAMRFRRNLSIAKDLKVRVLSYDSKKKAVVNEVVERKRVYNKVTSKSARSTEPAQEYVYNVPNLTADQARQRAQAILEELSKHEMNVQADLPGDLLLTAQNIVAVQGTGTVFDQTYYASTISRAYSTDGAFRMSLEAKNQTPNTAT